MTGGVSKELIVARKGRKEKTVNYYSLRTLRPLRATINSFDTSPNDITNIGNSDTITK